MSKQSASVRCVCIRLLLVVVAIVAVEALLVSAGQSDVRRRVQFRSVKNASGSLQTPSSIVVSRERTLIAVVVRNQAYALPTFLATLERLKCSEEVKCSLWWVGCSWILNQLSRPMNSYLLNESRICLSRMSDEQSRGMVAEWQVNVTHMFDSIVVIDEHLAEVEVEDETPKGHRVNNRHWRWVN